MVGELDVAVADRKATIKFLSDHVLFCFPDYRSAFAIVGQPRPSLKPIAKLLSFTGIGLKAKIGSRNPFELFPQPSWFVRWLNPAVREMVTWCDSDELGLPHGNYRSK